LSQKFLSEHKAQNVAQTIGPRLVQLNKANLAAELYLKVDLIKECIDAFISADEWGKAKKVAEQLDKSLVSYVEELYKQSLHKSGDIKAVADYDAVAALDIYATNNQWDECIKLAEKQNENVLHKYLARYVAFLIQKDQTSQALDLYKRYGAPAIPQNFNIYRKLAYDTMKLDSLKTREFYNEWSKLRDLLYSLNNNLAKSPEKEGPDHKTFQKLLLIAHYNTMRCSCAGNEQLDPIATKISISLLRHCDIIPADKAFYEAGIMCQKVKWDNMAFVFLNRYIDLADAIDDATGEVMDNSYLTDTDIPQDVNLPETKYLSVSIFILILLSLYKINF
jgi:intraflagellar transport protein 172